MRLLALEETGPASRLVVYLLSWKPQVWLVNEGPYTVRSRFEDQPSPVRDDSVRLAACVKPQFCPRSINTPWRPRRSDETLREATLPASCDEHVHVCVVD